MVATLSLLFFVCFFFFKTWRHVYVLHIAQYMWKTCSVSSVVNVCSWLHAFLFHLVCVLGHVMCNFSSSSISTERPHSLWCRHRKADIERGLHQRDTSRKHLSDRVLIQGYWVCNLHLKLTLKCIQMCAVQDGAWSGGAGDIHGGGTTPGDATYCVCGDQWRWDNKAYRNHSKS